MVRKHQLGDDDAVDVGAIDELDCWQTEYEEYVSRNEIADAYEISFNFERCGSCMAINWLKADIEKLASKKKYKDTIIRGFVKIEYNDVNDIGWPFYFSFAITGTGKDVCFENTGEYWEGDEELEGDYPEDIVPGSYEHYYITAEGQDAFE